MSVDRILALKLVGDVSSINKTLKKEQGTLKRFGASAGSWMKAAGIGLAIEGVSKLGDALGDAWAGFREGEKASAQLGTTWGNLNVKGADLQGTIDQIGRMTLKLGTDDVEAINAFNTALQMTGGKPAQAMNRLRIAQDLVANGSAPNLASAMKLIDRAGSGSAATVRKFGLTADTAGGRIKQLGEKVKGAAKAAAAADPIRVLLNGIGEGLETFVGALSKGDLEGALAGVQSIGVALTTAWTAVFPAIDKAMTALVGEENWTNAKNLAQGFLDAMSTIFAKLGVIWDGLAPHVQNAANLIGPWVGALGTVIGLFAENVMLVLDAIGDLLNGDFTGAWENVQKVIGNAVAAGGALITGFLGVLSGIVPGIVTAAQSIGQGIYDGIMGFLTGLPGALTDLVVKGINAIIAAWNELDFAIPKFDLPAVDIGFPSTGNGDLDKLLPRIKGGPWNIFGGTGDLIPDLTPLAKGGIVLPRPGGTLAQIGEAGKAEAVIPLDRMGDFGGGDTYNVTVYAHPTSDPAEVGRVVVDAIRSFRNRGGGPAIRAAVS